MATQPEQTVTAESAQGSDTGTDAPTRTLEQTQNIPYDGDDFDGENEVPPPSVAPGVGATEDSGTEPGDATPNQGTVATDSQSLTITPRPNILDQYPSYTWQASVYMVSPDQYDEFSKNPRRKISGYNLLFQSGGAANSSTPGRGRGAGAGTPEALFQTNENDGRNPYFTDDFYIDNISIGTLAAGKGTGTAHSYTEIKFTVTEPSNITLIDRLYLAAKDLAAKPTNVASALYIMIIRFYAMDNDGQIIQVGAQSSVDAGTGDRYALVEKYIPFQVKTINMTIDSKMVNYDWEGVPLGAFQGFTTRRGTIPFSVELTGATVDQMLSGDAKYSNAQAPANNPGATTTSTQPTPTAEQQRTTVLTAARASDVPPPKITASTVTRGIVAAMNEHQQRLKTENRREFPDVYKIAYTPEAEARIKQATVKKPSDRVPTAQTGSGPAASTNTSTVSPDKQQTNQQSRNLSINAGMQMVQLIEMIVRNSSYITDQANIVFDEHLNQARPNPQHKGNDKGFQWFTVIPSAKQLDQFDTKINDYAVEITYTIGVYEVRQINSPYFNAPRFQGVHKKYYYWFTGENNAVLEYKESHNNLYYQTVTGAIDTAKRTFSSSMVEIPYYWPAARSAESDQGAQGRANDLAANAAENLYNLADLANAKLKIIGDPAWMMQGSVIGVANPGQLTLLPFNDDGSINFDTQDVLFEIAWQKPEDYSVSTGLADPYSRFTAGGKRQPLQSRVYKTTRVLSEFRGGLFEQTIEGTIYMYPIPNGTNRAPDTVQPATSLATAETGASIDTESGASDESEDPRQDDTDYGIDRFNASTTGSSINGEGGTETTGQPVPSSATSVAILNSSLMQNTLGTSLGLRLSPRIDFSSSAIVDRTLASFPTTVADLAQSALPGLPITSNGLVIGIANTQLTLESIKVSDPQTISRDA